MSVPVVLSVAGSDPSGGAGVQADLKTMAAHGVYGAAVLTALTAQNTHGVQGVHPVPADFVEQQLRSVLGDLDVVAVKIGMLGDPAVAERVADALAAHAVPHVVLDPVMVATSGHRLVPEATVEVVRDRLLPITTVVTPNVPEAEVLAGVAVRSVDDLGAAGERLRTLGARAALVKGGHLEGPESVDVALLARSAVGAVEAERSLHTGELGERGVDVTAVEPSPTCRAYTGFLAEAAAQAPFDVALAAVVPCFRVYAEVGRVVHAGRATGPHPYAAWIDTYADPAFDAAVTDVERLLDRVAGDPAGPLLEAYGRATRFEWMFWDAAWRGERWPVPA
ncbi:bifunctional hydroxymethylpyrimidine kinase/phosphomethylpyrimidine kinase [Aeromicrobium sp. IC_218]|uniref:bifunctional hydroxymethylpyrimidine kinase/phosphomethylpyrimidine kinase n=1 Tax=Aeromicrobium sp. IC_218 TaxID=2545468 RepID=UPI00103AC7EB|nr:bifunctional hydroxymethylpyrimidine kinase/phosphomethylpyrimidine kinase [Aeromicrobium sp. IC_218]TCJ00355.1 bifunctional hydroxymethylpyrimidine kinase/phosphomethylpyrimidine kinase [Aeromicrobium sp. IC_218]